MNRNLARLQFYDFQDQRFTINDRERASSFNVAPLNDPSSLIHTVCDIIWIQRIQEKSN